MLTKRRNGVSVFLFNDICSLLWLPKMKKRDFYIANFKTLMIVITYLVGSEHHRCRCAEHNFRGRGE